MRFLYTVITCMIAALTIMSFSPNQAQAARFTGVYLLQLCEKGNDGREVIVNGHAICQSYIAGIIDTHNMMKSISRDFPSAGFCVPLDASLNEIHSVVLEYLRNNNQHDDFIAAPGVVTALFEAFPCR